MTVFVVPPSAPPALSQAAQQAAPTAATPTPSTRICGFWRRVFAFIIDCLIIGIAGFILGLFMFGFLSRLGPLGLLLGFGIAIAYFGILNSHIGRGQTLGKKWLGINVVGRDGQYISVPKSFLRYTVLSLPFFLNGVSIPLPETLADTFMPNALSLAAGLIVFGVGGSIIYLYIFNRRTRQSLHDLAVGSYVVAAPSAGRVKTQPVWKGHAVFVGIWILSIAVFVLVLAPKLVDRIAGKGALAEMTTLQRDIDKTGKVHDAAVQIVTQKFRSTGSAPTTTKYLRVTVTWKGKPDDLDEAYREIAMIIIKEFPRVEEQDKLVITVRYGFDIGIASAWRGSNRYATPREWRARLKGTEA